MRTSFGEVVSLKILGYINWYGVKRVAYIRGRSNVM